jgi:hypothetical protein
MQQTVHLERAADYIHHGIIPQYIESGSNRGLVEFLDRASRVEEFYRKMHESDEFVRKVFEDHKISAEGAEIRTFSYEDLFFGELYFPLFHVDMGNLIIDGKLKDFTGFHKDLKDKYHEFSMSFSSGDFSTDLHEMMHAVYHGSGEAFPYLVEVYHNREKLPDLDELVELRSKRLRAEFDLLVGKGNLLTGFMGNIFNVYIESMKSGIEASIYVDHARYNVGSSWDYKRDIINNLNKNYLKNLIIFLEGVVLERMVESNLGGFSGFTDIALLAASAIMAKKSIHIFKHSRILNKKRDEDAHDLNFYQNILNNSGSEQDVRRALAFISRLTLEDKPELEVLLEDKGYIPHFLEQKARNDWRFEIIRKQLDFANSTFVPAIKIYTG